MRIGVPRQVGEGETRAPLTPAVVQKLVEAGHAVTVEEGVGVAAGHTDQAYKDAGATVAMYSDEPPLEVWAETDVVVTLEVPDGRQIDAMHGQSVLIGMLRPLKHPELVKAMLRQGITAFSMEFLPRITRAQSMDVLSSQANIAGYHAVLMGAAACPKMFPMMITAAGTLAPARVFVLGAGVAGLQAIATAKRLGAVVEAYDIRPEVKEQVESLAARFVQLRPPRDEAGGGGDDDVQQTSGKGGYAAEQSEDQQKRQAELMAKHVKAADVVICTAAVFGKAPPLLVPQAVADQMQPGSVLVDMAADPDAGRGNCAATRPGETVTTKRGVTLIGELNLPARVPGHASQAYANNIHALLKEITGDEAALTLDLSDEVQAGACICHAGSVTTELVKSAVGE